MSSRGKKKATMAKLNREARLRERRAEKQTKKEARREATGASTVPVHGPIDIDDHPPRGGDRDSHDAPVR